MCNIGIVKEAKEIFKSIKVKISGIPMEYIDGDSTGDLRSGYYQQDLSFPDKETAKKYLSKVKVKVTIDRVSFPNSLKT